MRSQDIKHIAICGAGLAGTLCALALVTFLPEEIDLTLIDTPIASETDVFYGTVTDPTVYEFLLKLGIAEPDLLPGTNTTFSVGTHYMNWGPAKRSWIQSLHKPLPIFHGIEFHHYLTRIRQTDPEAANLEPYIMSALAASKGVFAHPPEDIKSPLSSLEYGYHFIPAEWRHFLSQKLEGSRLNMLSGDIESVDRALDRIHSLTLTGNTKVEADLFIDCTGPNSKINQNKIMGERRLRALASFKTDADVNASSRRVTGADYGWYSETIFQNGTQRLTIFAPESEAQALDAHGRKDEPPIEAPIGHVSKAWQDNCLALGHSAAILEPLSPAPMTLLIRDIERLLELIPNSEDMTVEAREYNRRFADDYVHGSIFQDGFFEDVGLKLTSYWTTANKMAVSPKLTQKISQFVSRGTIVQYDLEPFGKEDWVQQHFGMGRLPRRYDPLADKAQEVQILQTFHKMREANKALVTKLPPQHIYMKKLLEYLRKNHG